MLELAVQKREEIGAKKLSALRAEGHIPAVVYGKKEESTPIKLDKREFVKALKTAGESSIMVLKGLDDDKEVLIHEVDFEPVKGEPRHVDFYAIERGKKLTVTVPLEYVGVSPAIKDLGGVLTKVMHEIEIEVLPRDLPQSIDVDLSSLVDFEHPIHVSDIKLPEGVEVTAEETDVVAIASEAKEEVFEEPEAVDMDSIEVEAKGKEESDDSTGEEEKKED